MEQTIDLIPAKELFGAQSQLAEKVVDNSISGISSLGGGYQVATAIAALLFIFILVRYFDLFVQLVISAFSFQSNNSDFQLFSREAKNIEIVTSLTGSILLALLVMRLSVMRWSAPFLGVGPDTSVWALGGMTLVGIITLVLGERLLLYVIGFLSDKSNACTAIWHTKLLYFSWVMVLLAPLLILVLLTEGLVAQIALYLSVAVCSLSLILFIKETFLLFRTQRFSIFHWILYLCALEIFPLSLLLAPILRG